MNKETIKDFMPLMQAMLEGKTIQSCYNYDKKWVDVEEIIVEHGISSYRIKTEPKYRPFKNADECWEEMQKHQPFGWLKNIEFAKYFLIDEITSLFSDAQIHISAYERKTWGFDTFSTVFNNYTFADGAPFGVKVED